MKWRCLLVLWFYFSFCFSDQAMIWVISTGLYIYTVVAEKYFPISHIPSSPISFLTSFAFRYSSLKSPIWVTVFKPTSNIAFICTLLYSGDTKSHSIVDSHSSVLNIYTCLFAQDFISLSILAWLKNIWDHSLGSTKVAAAM